VVVAKVAVCEAAMAEASLAEAEASLAEADFLWLRLGAAQTVLLQLTGG